jgi:hypothetical protein
MPVQHGASPGYAPPIIRTASPASSVATVHGNDDTSPSDAELSQTAFEAKWNARIGLYGLTDAARQKEEKEKEDHRCGNPLLPEVATAAEKEGCVLKISLLPALKLTPRPE